MMIKVIGKENCGACMMAKKVLTRKGVEFEYVHLDELDEEECEEINKYCNSVLKSRNDRLLAISYTEDCFAEYVKAIHIKYSNKENALISVMKYFVDDENTTYELLKLIELLPSKSDAEVTSALYEYASSNPKRIIAAKEVAAISFLHDYLLGVNF